MSSLVPMEEYERVEAQRDALKARVADLEARLSSLDCRYAGGGIGEVSGSHCPADNPCDRCVAERRIAGLEAWQLAIAEGTQFINRAEGQDGYEVADPQTILKYFEEEAHERDCYQEALTVIYTNEDPESPARMTAFLALNPKR